MELEWRISTTLPRTDDREGLSTVYQARSVLSLGQGPEGGRRSKVESPTVQGNAQKDLNEENVEISDPFLPSHLKVED